MSISFSEDDVRSMGRTARGVKGITLKEGDAVAGMANLHKDRDVLTVTTNGYGKRTPTAEYRSQTRGGKGVIDLKVTEKTGEVIGLKVVTPDHELMLITEGGIVIRTNVSEISVQGRNTQGVKIMRTEGDDKVVSMATMEQKSE
mgnify:CR=1 FL=1